MAGQKKMDLFSPTPKGLITSRSLIFQAACIGFVASRASISLSVRRVESYPPHFLRTVCV